MKDNLLITFFGMIFLIGGMFCVLKSDILIEFVYSYLIVGIGLVLILISVRLEDGE